MAKVPGLRPFSEDTPTRGTSNTGRVVVNYQGPRMPRLEPKASPADTYAKPPRPEVDYRLTSFLDGLSAVNPALAQFAAVQQGDQAAQEDIAAKKWAAAKTPEERQALLKDPEVQGKFSQAWLGKMQSATTGDADQTELFRLYNEEIDKNGSVGDINTFVDNFVATRVQELGGPGAASGYLERMVGVKKSLVDHHQRLLTEQTLATQQQTTEDGILANIRNVIDLDAPDSSAVTSVNEILKTNKVLLNKPFKEQQAWVLSAVEKLTQDMERNPEKRGKIFSVIETLLDGPRVGEDGQSRRLTEAGEGVGAKAQEVLTQAKRKLYELNNQHGYKTEAELRNAAEYAPHNLSDAAIEKAVQDKVISPEAAAGLLNTKQGSILRMEKAQAEFDAEIAAQQAEESVVTQAYRKMERGELNGNIEDAEVPTKEGIMKGTGATRKLSSDEIKDRVAKTVENQLRSERDYLIAQKRPEAEVDAHIRKKELNLYAANGFAPPAWKREFKAAMRSLTTATLTAQNMPHETLEAFRKYRTIRDQHSNILGEVTDEETRAFFDAAYAGVSQGWTEETALSAAGTYFANRDAKVKEAEAVTRKSIMEALRSEEQSNWLGVRKLFGGEALENPRAIADKVADRATLLVQAFKIPPENAIEEATKAVRKNTAVVNGWIIDTNSKNLGVDFEKRAEKYLDLIYGTHKEKLELLGVHDRRDLVIVPMANGDMFHVISRTLGPLPEPFPLTIKGVDMNGQYLTPQYLEAVGNLMRDQEAEKAARAARQSSEPTVILRKSWGKDKQIPLYIGKSTPEALKADADAKIAEEEARRKRREEAGPLFNVPKLKRNLQETLGIPERNRSN